MELRQLQYFAAVARRGNVTRAAEDLYLTQSALSQQLRRLEGELGVALLRRTARGVELTAAGADLLERAEAAGAAMDGARRRARRGRGGRRGAAAGCAGRLPRRAPADRVGAAPGPPAEVAALVGRSAVDVGVAALPPGGAPAV